MPIVQCKTCQVEFTAKPADIKRGGGKYCSKACLSKALRSGEYLRCIVCGKKTYFKKAVIEKGGGKFCSQTCNGYWKSIHMVGESSTNWKGCITSEQKTVRSSKPFLDWRKAVFDRDNYTCQHCGEKGVSLNAHHIIPFSKDSSLRTDVSNGISLCLKCHNREHKRLREMLSDQYDLYVS